LELLGGDGDQSLFGEIDWLDFSAADQTHAVISANGIAMRVRSGTYQGHLVVLKSRLVMSIEDQFEESDTASVIVHLCPDTVTESDLKANRFAFGMGVVRRPPPN
jgi:hypothetical protein